MYFQQQLSELQFNTVKLLFGVNYVNSHFGECVLLYASMPVFLPACVFLTHAPVCIQVLLFVNMHVKWWGVEFQSLLLRVQPSSEIWGDYLTWLSWTASSPIFLLLPELQRMSGGLSFNSMRFVISVSSHIMSLVSVHTCAK